MLETRWPLVHPSVQFSSAAQSCPPLWDPMDCSTPDLPVRRQLPEFTQTHVHWVGDAIQPSHPLSSPSPPALNLSQPQGMSQLFASGGQSIGVSALASVLPINTQDWSPLEWTQDLMFDYEFYSKKFDNGASLGYCYSVCDVCMQFIVRVL